MVLVARKCKRCHHYKAGIHFPFIKNGLRRRRICSPCVLMLTPQYRRRVLIGNMSRQLKITEFFAQYSQRAHD